MTGPEWERASPVWGAVKWGVTALKDKVGQAGWGGASRFSKGCEPMGTGGGGGGVAMDFKLGAGDS